MNDKDSNLELLVELGLNIMAIHSLEIAGEKKKAKNMLFLIFEEAKISACSDFFSRRPMTYWRGLIFKDLQKIYEKEYELIKSESIVTFHPVTF